MKGSLKFYEQMYREGKVAPPPEKYLGRLFQKLRRYELHRTDAAIKLLKSKDSLLDLGCGSGSLMLGAMTKGFVRVTGIDISPTVIAGAKKNISINTKNMKNITIIEADLDKKLPFGEQTFDVVTCMSVLEHIFDPFFTIDEIRRVLKKDGQVILEVPNLAWFPRRMDMLFGVLPTTAEEEGWDGGHLHYFTFKAVRRLLEQKGFAIEYMGSTGIFPKLRNLWPSLLGGNIIVSATKK